jgi:hypothetical protein
MAALVMVQILAGNGGLRRAVECLNPLQLLWLANGGHQVAMTLFNGDTRRWSSAGTPACKESGDS